MADGTTTAITARRAAAERMGEAADAFLGALSAGQRSKAARPSEDAERTRWFYTPTVQAGLPLLEMDAPQQRLAHMLAATGLSLRSYNTVATIMGLENTLGSREGWRGTYFGYDRPSRNRDPLLYFLCIYGTPGDSRGWGWHFGGHHVSLNVTVKDGMVISPTPLFFGADPAESEGVGPNVLRPLAGEEELARELVHALDEGGRAQAIISPIAPFDLVQANLPRVTEGATGSPLWEIFNGDQPPERRALFETMASSWERDSGWTPAHAEMLRYTGAPKGVPAATLRGPQREIFDALLRQYVQRLPDDVAEVEWGELSTRGIGELHFAWAGGLERRQPHYYRVQGPRFLIEYDNVQNGANHIHSVWRDPEMDFGGGPLAAHHRQEHLAR